MGTKLLCIKKIKCLVGAAPGLGLGALPEAVLKLTRHRLQVAHTARAVGAALERLQWRFILV